MPRPSHEPVRTCVACRQEASKASLIRLVRVDGRVAADPTGHAAGRGAYLHATRECVEAARKRRSVERSLGASVEDAVWDSIAR